MLSKRKLILNFTIFVVGLSIASQFPTVSEGLSTAVSFFWLILGLFVLLVKKGNVVIAKFQLQFIALLIHVFLFTLVLGVFGYNHLDSNFLRVLIVPFGVYTVAFQASRYLFENDIKRILRYYLVFVLLLTVMILVNYIPSFDTWMNSSVYLYKQKNSAAQLMSCAAIWLFVEAINSKVNLYKVASIIAMVFLIGAMILIQARASIIACFIAVVYLVLIVLKPKTWVIAVFSILILTIILTENPLKQIVRQAFLIDKYQGKGLNAFSSGRLDLFFRALKQVASTPLIGTGRYYVDNMYILSITELGIIGGFPLILLWISRGTRNLKQINIGKSMILSAQNGMTIFFIVLSMMEGYPPYGPGVAAMIFWFLCGYQDRVRMTHSMMIKESLYAEIMRTDLCEN